MEEKLFFEESGVTVTNARFIVPTQMFAMSGITSVTMFREEPRRGWAIFLAILGVLFVMSGITQSAGLTIFGLLLGGAGVALLVNLKARYHVLLKTASGEAKAVDSTDMAFIKRIVAGLHQAIVHRG